MKPAKTVVVVGAAGFIGRHVCRTLAAQGVQVVGLGHGHWTQQEWSTWGLSRWLEADISLGALTQIADGTAVDALIHCAGSGSVALSYAAPLADFQRSVSSTADLLEFARTVGGGRKPRVVIASSAAVYGDQGDVNLSESAVRSPMSPYGFNKLVVENICDSYSRFFELPISLVRLFSVYGEGLRKQLLWDAVNKYKNGENSFLGTGHEVRDWIHIDDAANLLCAAALRSQAHYEIYNGGHHHAATRDILTALGENFLGNPAPFFTGETHTGNPRRLTSDSRHAQHELGWVPKVDLTEGISRYLAWFRNLSEPNMPSQAVN